MPRLTQYYTNLTQKNNRNKVSILFIALLVCSSLFVIFPLEGAGHQLDNKCSECHDDFDFKAFNSSKHKKIGCVGCHVEIKSLPHKEELSPVKCERCHKKAAREFKISVHAAALRKGMEDAPHCWDCHGSHDVHSKLETESHVYPNQIPATCGSAKCHSNTDLAKKHKIPILNPFGNYSKSVHAKKLAGGDMEAATCKDCHGGHAVLPVKDPRSTIHKDNVPKTCSKCHDDVYEDFVKSIHWKGYINGVRNAPVCTDCHLEHEIRPCDDPTSTVHHEKVPALCTDCHSQTGISKRYDLPLRTLKSYLNSFHGLALKSGNLEAAACTSCHATHLILKSNDPKSTVHPENLAKTCGDCHPGIGTELKTAKIHARDDDPSLIGAKVINIVKTAYIWIIVISCISMLAFCFLDLIAKTRRKRKKAVGAGDLHLEPEKPMRYFMRFNRVERALHLTIMITFTLLVYTGFCRSFPDAAFAYPMTKLVPYAIRDWIHRVAGAIITLNMILQFLLFAFTKRGREQLKALFPKVKDLKDAVGLILYNTGLSSEHPHFGRFSFMEKFEYWALIWGTNLMAVTGMMLWFKEVTMKYLPYWTIDLAQVLHFYEAVLATLAILIWHFYWVIFNPDVYPMDSKWITGKISEEHLMHEHYQEWESIVNSEKDEGAPVLHTRESYHQEKKKR
jgi:formate dehydrogenase gamma subunit